MKARYFPNTDFLQAKLGVNPSYVKKYCCNSGYFQAGEWKKDWKWRTHKCLENTVIPCRVNGFLTTDMPQELFTMKSCSRRLQGEQSQSQTAC